MVILFAIAFLVADVLLVLILQELHQLRSELLRVPDEQLPASVVASKVPQHPEHIVCSECGCTVARYDDRGVCLNCVSEGK